MITNEYVVYVCECPPIGNHWELHLIMHRTISPTGYIGPQALTVTLIPTHLPDSLIAR